jgi:WD40 repeat protein
MASHAHLKVIAAESVREILPDGQRIVTGSQDQTAKVWDAADGKELLTFKGHKEWVLSAAFSPDGQRIATGSADRTAKIWESASVEQVEQWQQEEKTVGWNKE